MNTSRGYLLYLLRLWPAGDEQPGAWRASLENPRTGERHGFADLGALFAFLQEETAVPGNAKPSVADAEPAGQASGPDAPSMGQELYELVGRAITDVAFRARLMEDPQRVAREVGYILTAEQVAGLKASDLQSLAETVDERLFKRFG
jgi:hypothetical protein